MKKSLPASAIERALSQRLLASYRRSFEVAPERIIVGFSGGSDSLALAILLRRIAGLIESEIVLLHVDHRMRPDSGDDAKRCLDLAAELDLPIMVRSLDDHPQRLFPGVGPEEAARRGRYLVAAREAGPGDRIALAHHAGDQAETVLLHLLRGSGVEGLGGMSESSSLEVPWWSDDTEPRRLGLWRPLLRERKSDLIELVSSRGMAAIVDESNFDLSFRRNEVRHRLLPLLEDIEPTIEERMGNLADIAAAEDDFIENLAEQEIAHHVAAPGLPRSLVLELHPALVRRIVRRWFQRKHRLELTFDRVEAIRNLAGNTNSGAAVEVGSGIVAWNEDAWIYSGSNREPGSSDGETQA